VKQRLFLAIVGLALLAGAVNVAGATLPAASLSGGTDQHATFVAPHEANIATPASTGARERRLQLFGAVLTLLALLLAAICSTPAAIRTPASGRRGRFFVRRRGPPASLVTA
jgi:hypothetical protein